MTAATHAPAAVEVPRHHAFGRFCRAYARRPAGLAGLGLLVAFGALALAAPLFIGDDQLNVIRVDGPQLSPPVDGYPLGTDQAGRSVLLLVIWGARESLSIGIIATALTVVLGSTVGLLAGHYQGRVGQGLMHVTDWFIALPSLPLAISLSAVLGQGAASITIAIAVTSWTATARLVRAQTLAVEARPFIERARALGAGNTQIMIRHVLPNVMPLILVSSTLTVASAILSEATLTFLGLGDPTSVTWGSMLQAAFAGGAVTAGAWWYLIPPGIAILIVVLGFTLVGRAVEHVLNPRMVGR
ncbi:ABC transporter permease [Streptosporangium roseum]|uniref:ABC transporter, permease n=1 Tax=Streptosporangium roseum (strain ATCC 12428 / DSM 43021 / JCM 3005 / KCTC 9067 / NCIMB 10171 / NRRL 2505 / NI 9100) TaxID=479432 RepID=D2BE83_STRRD|nr:ABC transporter permease [Streptosporangium roseum]ACZ90129.1 ABC transporter, permease [Streptosporangium roseum DSM 43021]